VNDWTDHPAIDASVGIEVFHTKDSSEIPLRSLPAGTKYSVRVLKTDNQPSQNEAKHNFIGRVFTYLLYLYFKNRKHLSVPRKCAPYMGALAAAGCAWSSHGDPRYCGKWAWLARRGHCTASSWAQRAVRINKPQIARSWLVFYIFLYRLNRNKDSYTLSHTYNRFLAMSLLYCGKNWKKNGTSFFWWTKRQGKNIWLCWGNSFML